MNKKGGIEAIIAVVILVGIVIALIIASVIPAADEANKMGNNAEKKIDWLQKRF